MRSISAQTPSGQASPLTSARRIYVSRPPSRRQRSRPSRGNAHAYIGRGPLRVQQRVQLAEAAPHARAHASRAQGLDRPAYELAEPVRAREGHGHQHRAARPGEFAYPGGEEAHGVLEVAPRIEDALHRPRRAAGRAGYNALDLRLRGQQEPRGVRRQVLRRGEGQALELRERAEALGHILIEAAVRPLPRQERVQPPQLQRLERGAREAGEALRLAYPLVQGRTLHLR